MFGYLYFGVDVAQMNIRQINRLFRDHDELGDVEFQSDISYQDCGCNDCGCRWNEIYKFCRKEAVK